MRLIYPLNGIGKIPGIYKTQGFGENPSTYAQFGMKGHNGIDWAAPKGTPVLACHDGIVEYFTGTTGYGNYARIYFTEDGITWDIVNGHLSAFEGDKRAVKAGEVIGYVGTTGFSTGNHLHFGIRKTINGQIVDNNNGYFGYVDPEPYLSMTNVKIIKNGSEYAFYVPATNEASMIDKALNYGLQIPTKEGGTKIDWEHFSPDITL